VPERRALFAVPVDRAEQRIDVHQRQLLQAGQEIGAVREGEQVSAEHRTQLADVAEGEFPQKDPHVADAYTAAKSRFIPPERITSRSAMLSAPAGMPAMIEGQLRDGVRRAGPYDCYGKFGPPDDSAAIAAVEKA
jgi:hypothetical protein